MGKKMNIKKIIIIGVAIILLLIVGYGVYSYNKEDNGGSTDNNNVKTNNRITTAYVVTLNDKEREFTLQGKVVKAKVVNKELYINGEKIAGVKANDAVVTELIIVFTYNGKCNSIISYVVNADGESVPFTENNYQLYDFRMYKDQFVAAGSSECPCYAKKGCNENPAISLTYTGSELVIK